MNAKRTATKCLTILGMLLASGTCLLSPPAAQAAEPSAKDRASAEALFVEAKRLMESDQYADACPKLEESQKQDPAGGTLMYLAHCYEKTNRSAKAWTIWREAESFARNAHQAEREKTARGKAEALERTLSSLRIDVPTASRIDGLEVKSDGVVVKATGWGEAVPVDPGDHVVSASAPGRKPWKRAVQIGASRTQEVLAIPSLDALDKAPVTANSRDPSSSASAEQPKATGSFWKQRNIGYVVGAAGLVGLGVGTMFGLRARSKEADSDKHCYVDNRSLCDTTGIRLNQEAKDAQTVALAALIGGGVATAAGLVLVLTSPSSKADASSGPKVGMAPGFGPGFGGWVVKGTW